MHGRSPQESQDLAVPAPLSQAGRGRPLPVGFIPPFFSLRVKNKEHKSLVSKI